MNKTVVRESRNCRNCVFSSYNTGNASACSSSPKAEPGRGCNDESGLYKHMYADEFIDGGYADDYNNYNIVKYNRCISQYIKNNGGEQT